MREKINRQIDKKTNRQMYMEREIWKDRQKDEKTERKVQNQKERLEDRKKEFNTRPII